MAEIAELTATIASTTDEIADLSGKIAADESELKDATLIRAKEAGEFATNEADLVETIDTLSRAISILEREMAKNPAPSHSCRRAPPWRTWSRPWEPWWTQLASRARTSRG